MTPEELRTWLDVANFLRMSGYGDAASAVVERCKRVEPRRPYSPPKLVRLGGEDGRVREMARDLIARCICQGHDGAPYLHEQDPQCPVHGK